ncbi:MAG: Panacea domain-containing protein [Candidatus Hydrothermarchaeota archaeon]
MRFIDKKIRDIIVYFAFKTRFLTERRLMKLIYISEIYHIKKFGKRLTNARFYNYHYGPWSPDIALVGEVISGEDILIEYETTKNGHEASFFKPNVSETTVKLSKEEISTLEDVLKDWKFKRTNDLINFAKSTVPHRESEFGEVIDFDKYVKEIILDEEIPVSSPYRILAKHYGSLNGKQLTDKDKEKIWKEFLKEREEKNIIKDLKLD